MISDSITALTPMQQTCLRMVFDHKSSKDIARALGTSPHTVDNHIKSAMQRLGAANRREAAILLAQSDRRALASQSQGIGMTPVTTPQLNPQSVGKHTGGARVKAQLDVPLAERITSDAKAPSMLRLPFPRNWGEENELTAPQRVLWLAILTIAGSLAFGAVMASIRALNAIF